MPDNDSTAIGKLFTVEMLGSLVVSVFIMSGMWFGLTSRSEANSASIDELKTTQDDLVRNVVTIDKNVATLLVRQQAASKAMELSNARMAHDLENLKIFMQRMHSK